MTRRFIAPALLGASLVLTGCGGSNNTAPGLPFIPPTTTPPATQPQAQKNVLFFLGDGMGITTMTAARIYKVGEDGDLTMDTLPETAFVHTYSNDAQVTDSAPSMSAYMTGVKMNNEVISMSADTKATDASGKAYHVAFDSTCPSGNGQAVETLLEQSKAKGYATGVVTTTRITHATPAATYSHVCHRDAENTIAAALVPGGAGYNAKLGDGVDVFFGGGTDYFLPKVNPIDKEKIGKRNDGRDLTAELKTAKYSYAATRGEFDKLPVDGTTKIAGLFTKSHMAYDLDRDAAKEPSLAEMTGKAIDALAARKKGFFLMVEGGRIDHALHATNARRALQDTGAFDDAIKLALEKMQAIDPGLKNTLVVVTADHDHTLQLNGYAARTGKTEAGKPGVLGLVKDYVDTSKTSKDVDGNPYTIIGFGNGPRRLATRGAIDSTELESKDYRQEAVVPTDAASDSETHGGADVFLGAQGMGAENFSGVITNTDVFGLIRKAVGL
ncbi:alkaline phosphatase [Variovorax sp. J22G73]|uniref:alkaline phosphatase n=1 Tax=unclassified Variovorax TaxID=663243 RepID=UPI0025787C60|nr:MULTISPECIES: alkaline phosphatase [unclassified Variovorax]MDM0004625.1 alkaline phosphatase [Variovorax sp. J22R203]MDM0095709.1 alkaline phosphatase [Variovorax sp. J22G73]